VAANPETREAAEAYLLEHRYADQMDLVFTVAGDDNVILYSKGEARVIDARRDPNLYTFGVFDVLATSSSPVNVRFELKASLKTGPSYTSDYAQLLGDQGREQDLGMTVWAFLAAQREYTYMDLLDMAYLNRELLLLPVAYDWLQPSPVVLWGQNLYMTAAVFQNGTLLWPAVRDIMASETIIPTGGAGSIAREMLPPEMVSEIRRRAVYKDVDFWMF
jgi:hypothetical protein